jgi:hypothetical protein
MPKFVVHYWPRHSRHSVSGLLEVLEMKGLNISNIQWSSFVSYLGLPMARIRLKRGRHCTGSVVRRCLGISSLIYKKRR